MVEKEKVRFEKEQAHKKSEDLLSDTVSCVRSVMIEHIDHQGLFLCEDLNIDNLEQYISYVISGITTSTIIKVNKQEPVIIEEKHVMSHEDHLKFIEEADMKFEESNKMYNLKKQKYITKFGKKDLEDEYEEFFKKNKMYGRCEPNKLHMMLIKTVGEDEYNKMVNRNGEYHYDMLTQGKG